jgi:hypothetical protein
MKMNRIFITSGACLSLTLAVALVACKKNNPVTHAMDQATTVSLAASSSVNESLYGDVFDVVTQEGENQNMAGRERSGARVTGCATVTLSSADPNTWPKTMTIDFGTGCTTNSVLRKGRLIITLTGKLRIPGSVWSVSFDNYYVNGYKLEGTFSITNSSNGTTLSMTTQTTSGKVTYPDNSWYTHSGTHTLTLVGGASTPTFADDSYSITGNGQTASSAGNNLSVTITTPLVRNANCHYLVSGTEQFTYNTASGTLDFGSGNCDNQATLTIGSFTTAITLP